MVKSAHDFDISRHSSSKCFKTTWFFPRETVSIDSFLLEEDFSKSHQIVKIITKKSSEAFSNNHSGKFRGNSFPFLFQFKKKCSKLNFRRTIRRTFLFFEKKTLQQDSKKLQSKFWLHCNIFWFFDRFLTKRTSKIVLMSHLFPFSVLQTTSLLQKLNKETSKPSVELRFTIYRCIFLRKKLESRTCLE